MFRVMKKVVLLSVLGVIFLVAKSDAQRFVASFGVTHQWGMPYEVYHTLEHDFWGYDVVHASRISNRRADYFEVVLQRGDVFVRVNVGFGGQIMRTVTSYNYPLVNHICTDYCGFHSDFYNRNNQVCRSNHHHGHNHVVYAPVVYNSGHHHGNGHNHYNNGNHNGHHNNGNHYGNNNGNHNEHHNNGNHYGNDHGNRNGQNNGNHNNGNGYNRNQNQSNNGRTNDGQVRNEDQNNNQGRGGNGNSSNGRNENGSTRTSESRSRTANSQVAASYPSRRSN